MNTIKRIVLFIISHIMSFDSVQRIINYKLNEKYFVFKSKQLKYFFHSYNNFGKTERSIEIPIVNYYLGKLHPTNVLEIGNVTKHYYDSFKAFMKKDTLDKYEIAYDVINKDIAEYKTAEKYDFIYSISTFEHMDSDGGRNKDYILRNSSKFSSIAFQNIDHVISNLLLEGGTAVILFPFNYCNREIDESIYSEEYNKFDCKKVELTYFEKKKDLRWVEIKQKRIIEFGKEHVHPVKFIGIMEIMK